MKGKYLSLKLCLDTSIHKKQNILPKINFLCEDNYMHIRFRKYNREEKICGFEQKLSYLLTYIMTKEFMSRINQIEGFEDKSLEEKHESIWQLGLVYFKNSPAYKKLFEAIEQKLPKFEGIKLFRFYSKKNYNDPFLQFGIIEEGAYPSEPSKNYLSKIKPCLDIFLNVLNISLEDYLFNDRYYLEINYYKDLTKTIYKKFSTKYKNKLKVKTKRDVSFSEINLWN